MSKETVIAPIKNNVIFAEFLYPSNRDFNVVAPSGFAFENDYIKEKNCFKRTFYKEVDMNLTVPWGFRASRDGTSWQVNGEMSFDILLSKLIGKKLFSDLFVTKQTDIGLGYYLYTYDENGNGFGEYLRNEIVPYIRRIFENGTMSEKGELEKAILEDSELSEYLSRLEKDYSMTWEKNSTKVKLVNEMPADAESASLSASNKAERLYGSVVSIKAEKVNGTGFLVDKIPVDEETDRLFFITCKHVLYKEDNVEHAMPYATFKGCIKQNPVTPIAYATDADLALFSIDVSKSRGASAEIISLSQSAPDEQTSVSLIGNDLGKDLSVLSGTVINSKYNDSDEYYLRTDVNSNPGCSGGPIINAHGECIGIQCKRKSATKDDCGKTHLLFGIALAIPTYKAQTANNKAELSKPLKRLLGKIEEIKEKTKKENDDKRRVNNALV